MILTLCYIRFKTLVTMYFLFLNVEVIDPRAYKYPTLLEPVMRIDRCYTMCRLQEQGHQCQTYIGPISNITPHNDAQHLLIHA